MHARSGAVGNVWHRWHCEGCAASVAVGNVWHVWPRWPRWPRWRGRGWAAAVAVRGEGVCASTHPSSPRADVHLCGPAARRIDGVASPACRAEPRPPTSRRVVLRHESSCVKSRPVPYVRTLARGRAHGRVPLRLIVGKHRSLRSSRAAARPVARSAHGARPRGEPNSPYMKPDTAPCMSES